MDRLSESEEEGGGEEGHYSNLTRKIPPGEPSVWLVNPDKLESLHNCSHINATTLDWTINQICAPKKESRDNVLVTMFTTMHDSLKNHYLYENVIYLHSFLRPRMQPMLFVSSPAVERNLVKDACERGWYVMTAPVCDKNKLPVLSYMFRAAQSVQESTFYGYANGDIVFDESLIKTLDHIKTMLKHFKQTLFVGRRTNIKVT